MSAKQPKSSQPRRPRLRAYAVLVFALVLLMVVFWVGLSPALLG